MSLRPTPDAMRERAFAVLGDRVTEARVLDLYAGTGAVGLEALSRGAESVVFVDSHRAAARLVRANCASLDLDEARTRLIVRPVLRAVRDLAANGDSFDLAWADPPFDIWQEGVEALSSAFDTGLLARHALACFECPAKADVEGSLPGDLRVARDLAGGASRVVMVNRAV